MSREILPLGNRESLPMVYYAITMMRRDVPIEEIFRVALNHELEQRGRGAQTEIVKKTDLKPAYLNHIVKGRKYGSESVRRAIASALGYEYEDFLDVGREIMGIRKKRTAAPQEFPRLPFQDELDQFGEHTYERIFVICQQVGTEMGWDGFINIIKGLPGHATLPGQEEYLRKEISDYELYEKVKEYAEKVNELL